MKPEKHIKQLLNAVSDSSRIQSGQDGQVIPLLQPGPPVSLILHEGTASLYRGRDHLLITIVKAPVIIGLNFFIAGNQNLYLQARGTILYECIPKPLFINAIRKNNLWESLAFFYMFSTQRLLDNHLIFSGVSTYDLVRNHLLALMNEDEMFRLKTNVCDYIQEKTLLSRSGIMKMLSELKKGEYIEIQRGILLKINKLPMKY